MSKALAMSKAGRRTIFKPFAVAFLATIFSLIGNYTLFPGWGFSIPLGIYLWYFISTLIISGILFWKGVLFSPLIGGISAFALLLFVPSYSVPVLTLIWFVHAVIGTVSAFLVNSMVR